MKKDQRGFGFVETVVGVGIAAAVLIGILAAFQAYLRSALYLPERVQANFLAEEGLEALRIIRDGGWAPFSALSGTRYLAYDAAGGWTATTTPQYIDGMLRSFVLSNVNRGAGDDIVASGGTNDPYTKRADVTVAWVEKGATSTLTLSTYFTDIHAQ